MEKLKFLTFKDIFLLTNFNNSFKLKQVLTTKRIERINFFFLSLFFFISNGKTIKKIFLLKFYLNLKIGEMFLTRSKFSYLKKNKKIIKR